jgi:TRAP-type mannitol/chloroaromatic compound transport system permease large subunit
MLVLLAALVAGTGVPVWALLLGVASLGAALGVATGAFDAGVLGATYPRLVNLLEHDLLQAMPLYVFFGFLLQRLPVADALVRCFSRLLRGTGAGAPLAAFASGALLAPMNGSVASSSALLSRLVAPRLSGLAPARALSLVAAAATIGVVVPPSLVLLLLGDAMLRAHTEAANLAGAAFAGQRIVNTQDVLHAALLPAVAVLVLWAIVAWRQGRQARSTAWDEDERPLAPREMLLGGGAILGVLLLLAAVFTGRMLAVEAAATGGCVLAVLAVLTRSLDARAWNEVLLDTLGLGGALFALLVAATTFSLVFGLFGTGAWLAQVTAGVPGSSLLLLAFVAACAWVLDAFELIFVIVPIVAPLLVVQMADAQQVAVLLLLVLQAGFLLPPLGYAILMTRAHARLPAVSTRALLVAVAPYVVVQLLVGAAVYLFPATVHTLDTAGARSLAPAGAESDEDLVRRMREMGPSPLPEDGPATEPSGTQPAR